MKIKTLETFLANAGLRNYLFVRLTTDTGLTGIGEATLEWQEKAVEVLLNEWVASRIIGRDPFDIEAVVGGMIRDQYQGGSTVMTAISGVEIAMWDIIGKATGQPVYRLIGGRAKPDAAAPTPTAGTAAARRPADFAARAREVVGARLPAHEVRPVRHRLEGARAGRGGPCRRGGRRGARGGRPGCRADDRDPRPARRRRRRSASSDRLDGHRIHWCEEPVAPESLDLLREVKDAHPPADLLRRAALHAGRLRPADQPARLRRGADGRRPLRRHRHGQEDRGDGGGAGHRASRRTARSGRSRWPRRCTSPGRRRTC